jgi:subtilisin family serine protease
LTGETAIFAPGKEIESSTLQNQFITLSGSSQAAPVVAGVAALLLEYYRRDVPGFRADELREILLSHGTPAPFGKIINMKNTI